MKIEYSTGVAKLIRMFFYMVSVEVLLSYNINIPGRFKDQKWVECINQRRITTSIGSS